MSSHKAGMLPRFIGAAFLCVAVGCAVSSLDTGGSSGTEVSAMVGTVVDGNGNSMANTLVRIRPADFLADSAQSASYCASHSLLDTITGSNGTFSFATLLPDTYTVEVACDDTLGSIVETRILADRQQIELPPLFAMPLARVSGTVQINYGIGVYPFVQVYGLNRSVMPDPFGNFSISVPQGKHRIHIGGYFVDTVRGKEFDGMDFSLEVAWGEQKYIGVIRLRQPPPPPCLDGSCDSMVVRRTLDMVGMQQVRVHEVTKTENGRIVELNLRGYPLPNGIPPDINKLIELRVLDLGQTGLPIIFPDMGRMTKLEIIRFDGDHIQMFSSGIGSCTALKELNLYGNELTVLPPSILNLDSLTYLNVGNNRLCWVDPAMAAWIDKYDPDWRTNQRCK